MRSLDLVTRANAEYVDEQYRRYREDPSSVDENWALFFAGFELAANGNGASGVAAANGDVVRAVEAAPAPPAEPVIGVFDLVHSYRELGHLVAHLNPLAPKPAGHPRSEEHTSELQSQSNLVCRLLLEKKK